MFISDHIKTDVVTITPRLAKQLLHQNTGNRRVANTNLQKIKTAMARDEWVFNGEAIKISKSGKILDGQHRLIAAAETGTTFQTLIVYGLNDTTQDSMDTGKARTIADILTIRGYKNASSLAAITVAIIRSEQWGIRAATINGANAYTVTPPQAVDRIEQEPSLTEIHRAVAPATKIGLPARTGGLLFYKLSEINCDDAQDFFFKLTSGEGLNRGNPVLTLRNLLIALKAERGQKDQTYIAALVIKAWNKYRNGQDLFTLRFVPGGAKPEPFPEPR